MTIEEKKFPKIGAGVMIQNDKGEVLLGLRIGAHGEGSWAFPGGHMEFGETIFQCAEREVKEETGLTVKAYKIISLADNMEFIETKGKQYVTIGVLAQYLGGEPRIIEPDMFKELRWFAADKLPQNLVFSASIYFNNKPVNLLAI